MTATAKDSGQSTSPSAAIDGMENTYWICSSLPTWYRIDMGGRHRVLRMSHLPRSGHSMFNYKIYVTDSTSSSEANWGTPVLTGSFPSDYVKTYLDFRGEGRYLIITGDPYGPGPAFMELSLWGDRIDPIIDTFSVSDCTTGMTGTTDEAIVNVTLTAHMPDGSAIAGYLVTEEATPPLADDPDWLPAAPATFTLTTEPPAFSSVYGWVKGANDLVFGTSCSIYYATDVPVISNIAVYPCGSTAAAVSWSTDVEAVGSVRYRLSGDIDWITAPWTTTPATSHWRLLTGLMLSDEYEFIVDTNSVSSAMQTYLHDAPAPEITPKTAWVATAQSTSGSDVPARGIDGNTGTYWMGTASPNWYRIDLGGRYRVQRLDYLPRNAGHSYRNYEIYVTDSTSATPSAWEAPAASGTFAYDDSTKSVDLLGYGRYVIIYGEKYASGPTVKEISLWGIRVDPVIDSFVVSDASSGETGYTDDATVGIELTAHTPGGTINGYMVNEFDLPPDPEDLSWSTVPVTSYTIEGSPGIVTLYGWVRDSSGAVLGTTDQIYYEPMAPAISDIAFLGTTETVAMVTWSTDIAAVGRIRYQVEGDPDWIATEWEAAPALSHWRVMTDLSLGTTYTVIVDSNGVSSDPITYVHETYAGEIPKSVMTGSARGVNGDASILAPYDGLTNDHWTDGTVPSWYRIDLGARYRVQRLGYLPRVDNHSFRNYELYVTDSPSTDKADWGEPVATGTFDYINSRTDVDLLGSGRYFIIYGDRYVYGPSIAELWLYGLKIDPDITFAVSDQATGNTGFTTTATVNVQLSATAPDGPVTDFIVNETPEPPAPNDEAWGAATATYTLLAEPGGMVTVYAWAKSASGLIAGKTVSILYQPAVPAISGIDVFGTDDTSGMAVFTTDVPAVGRVRYMADGDVDWTVTPWETVAGTTHWRLLDGLQLGVSYTVIVDCNSVSSAPIIYVHDNPAGEISKDVMTATASSEKGGMPVTNAIDRVVNPGGNFWGAVSVPAWLRVDLGERYRVQRYSSIPRASLIETNPSFEVYVTDSESDVKADWGAPAASVRLEPTIARTDVNLLGYGRYVVIWFGERWSGYGPTIGELWLYGKLIPSIGVSSFTVADQSTGSMLFTNDATVNVSMTIDGETITGYMITETGDKPAVDDPGWLAEVPAACTIVSGEGQKVLYAWVTDGANVSDARTTGILFSTAVPVVSGVAVADNGNGTATATWTTDIAAQGGLNYGEVKMNGTTPNSAIENAVGLSHSVSFAITADTNYKIIPVNNEIAGDAIYWPLAWPIEGDANGDCRVNILDLIFIRNKLNQAVTTGDNWKADVNNDTRINILDLIFVRNKLNTQCPL